MASEARGRGAAAGPRPGACWPAPPRACDSPALSARATGLSSPGAPRAKPRPVTRQLRARSICSAPRWTALR
eukprot:6670515-Lingulodinium_polyedra.AAC.1